MFSLDRLKRQRMNLRSMHCGVSLSSQHALAKSLYKPTKFAYLALRHELSLTSRCTHAALQGDTQNNTRITTVATTKHLSNMSFVDIPSMGALPFQGNLKQMERPPSVAELQQLLSASIAAIDAYQRSNPHVQNLPKLQNRIKRDLLFVTRHQEAAQQQASPEQDGLSESRLQGIVNNLRGFHGELLALHEAPGVIAVCKKFSSAQPKVWAPCCNISQKPAATAKAAETEPVVDSAVGSKAQPSAGQQQQHAGASCYGWWEGEAVVVSDDSNSDGLYGSSPSHSSSSSCGGDGGDGGGSSTSTRGRKQGQGAPTVHGQGTYTLCAAKAVQDAAAAAAAAAAAPTAGAAAAADRGPVLVEVDVVANDGLTWIEVKNQERFGLESVHWVGGSHCKGLAQQVADLTAVAAAPVNSRRWRRPQVVVYFPSGVSEEVGAALQEMGATVAEGPGSLAALPVPAPPSITNLDVTTLCALVSEVSWGDPSSAVLQAWAERTSHWQECLAAQVTSPLLPELHACLDNTQQLVTSCLAVQQFQKLMDMFAGPREQQRWQSLLQQLAVYHCRPQQRSGSRSMPSVCTCCGKHLAGYGTTQAAGRAAGVAVVAAAAGCDVGTTEAGPSSNHSSNRSSNCSSSPAADGAAAAEQQQCFTYSEPQRIKLVDKLGKQQRAVFGLGDALQAITLTANGNAVRCCEQYGVKLEVVLHRPVWLTGM